MFIVFRSGVSAVSRHSSPPWEVQRSSGRIVTQQSPFIHTAHSQRASDGNPHPRCAAQWADPNDTGLVVTAMDSRTAFYFGQGLAASSVKTYQSGVNRYLKFCQSSEHVPLPVSQCLLCTFVSQLADEGLKHRSIKTYLSGVRHYQIRSGYHDPFRGAPMPRLEYVMKGIKRHQSTVDGASRTRLPITPSLLRKLKEVWSASGAERDTKLMWAACCLCFFGFMRAGELTVPNEEEFDEAVHLCVSDLALDDRRNPSMVRVTVKQSKTDSFRKGVDLFIGRTGTDLCPVAALLDFISARGPRPGPLFVFKDGSTLTRKRFVDWVREALAKTGIDQTKYCGHSFRLGAATTAAAKGVEDCIIKTLGRWESLAYLQYVKLPREQLSGYSAVLAS